MLLVELWALRKVQAGAEVSIALASMSVEAIVLTYLRTSLSNGKA